MFKTKAIGTVQQLDNLFEQEKFYKIKDATITKLQKIENTYRSLLIWLFAPKEFKVWSERDEITIHLNKATLSWKARLFPEKKPSVICNLYRNNEEFEIIYNVNNKKNIIFKNEVVRKSVLFKELKMQMLYVNDASYRRFVNREQDENADGSEEESLKGEDRLLLGIIKLLSFCEKEKNNKKLDEEIYWMIQGMMDYIKHKHAMLNHAEVEIKYKVRTLINKDLMELVTYFVNISPKNQKKEKERVKKILGHINEKIYLELEVLDKDEEQKLEKKINFLYKKFD